jgi:hypothetical protein
MSSLPPAPSLAGAIRTAQEFGQAAVSMAKDSVSAVCALGLEHAEKVKEAGRLSRERSRVNGTIDDGEEEISALQILQDSDLPASGIWDPGLGSENQFKKPADITKRLGKIQRLQVNRQARVEGLTGEFTDASRSHKILKREVNSLDDSVRCLEARACTIELTVAELTAATGSEMAYNAANIA